MSKYTVRAQFASASCPRKRARRAIRVWLLVVAALMVVTLVVGGATRLTESACRSSSGSRSPASCRRFDEQAWQDEFDKYRQSRNTASSIAA